MKTIKSWSAVSLSVAALLSVSGCISVGPDYEQPELVLADSWNRAIVDELHADAPSIETWWDVFNDPTLSAIIAHASTNSLDLKVAMARVDEAAAQAGVARSERLPQVSGQGQAQLTQRSEATNPGVPAGTDLSGELFQLGVGVGWEIDLWGRVRRSVESAEASYEASLEDQRDTLVILYAAIATAYVEVRTLQQRIDFAEKNIELQEETHTLTDNRYQAGLSSRLDVWQAELNLATTRALIPSLRAQSTAALNRLGVLVGDEPSSLWTLLGKKKSIPAPPKDVMVGLPVDLLRQRPDVRAAERRLAAQNARIGVARAQLYPTFTLPGTFVLESLEAGDLLQSSSLSYGFGPAFRWNLFNGGAVRRSVEIEEARTAQAYHGYEKTVLLALESVENAMSAFEEERHRLASLQTASSAAAHSVELVKTLYKSGLTDFQNVLDMERSLTQQEDQLSVSEGNLAKNVIVLYRALGGGGAPEESESDEDDELGEEKVNQ